MDQMKRQSRSFVFTSSYTDVVINFILTHMLACAYKQNGTFLSSPPTQLHAQHISGMRLLARQFAFHQTRQRYAQAEECIPNNSTCRISWVFRRFLVFLGNHSEVCTAIKIEVKESFQNKTPVMKPGPDSD